MDWISVNTLPPRKRAGAYWSDYVLFTDGKRVYYGRYRYNAGKMIGWYQDGIDHVTSRQVTHWMPLPEVPDADKGSAD